MKSLTKKMEMMNHDFELYWVKNREVHFDPFLTRRVQKTEGILSGACYSLPHQQRFYRRLTRASQTLKKS